MPEIFMIAAVPKNGVIGADNDMPWRLPSDLKYFKVLTLGKPVIMGRKTFLSFGGKPLPGRPHVVITRDPDYRPNLVNIANSLEEAIEISEKLAAEIGADEIAVIGGGQIYAQAIGLAQRLEITEVDAEPEGDTKFPEISPEIWEEVSRKPGERSEKDSADFTFVTYRRRS